MCLGGSFVPVARTESTRLGTTPRSSPIRSASQIPTTGFTRVCPRGSTTPRDDRRARPCLLNSSPDAYETWLRETVRRFEPFGQEENLVFVNAWNEWAEGNHLEPCQRWGRAYLEAHARVVANLRSAFRQPTSTAADPATASLGS